MIPVLWVYFSILSTEGSFWSTWSNCDCSLSEFKVFDFSLVHLKIMWYFVRILLATLTNQFQNFSGFTNKIFLPAHIIIRCGWVRSSASYSHSQIQALPPDARASVSSNQFCASNLRYKKVCRAETERAFLFCLHYLLTDLHGPTQSQRLCMT